MKAHELITYLETLDPNEEISVNATPSQSLPASIIDSTIVPMFPSKFDDRRGSLAIRRKPGEAFLLVKDGQVLAEIRALKDQTVRITAPRTVTVMRNEIAHKYTGAADAEAEPNLR